MSGPYPGHRSALTPRRHRIERDVRPGQTSSATATERSLILGVRLPSVSSLGRTAQQAARVCLFCLLAAAALSACDNGAQPTATLTPELTATPTSTLTPTPTPTVAAPSPPVDGGSRSAADYTGGYVNRCVNDIRPSQPLIQWRFHPHTVHRGRRLRSTQGPSDA